MTQKKLREDIKVVAERAVLVAVHLPGEHDDPSDRGIDPLGELKHLARTAGARVVGEMLQRRRHPEGHCYIGRGKLEELTHLVEQTKATLVIFDNDLSPGQIRAVEESCRCKVIDRSELILDIFANRAATHAAKLQVEIAQLEYTYPRLRAMWDHLGQIVGGAPVGIGTRGPGEKQLEIDRRIVQRRLKQLRSELELVQQRKTREVAKRRTDHYTVGLVGYTNAGKSTLFNRLTGPAGGGAFAHDRLFATLSTRIERWNIGGGNSVMLSDTVGFIRNLPHHLVASFRSTLEETIAAHLLIIVVDVSDPSAEMHLKTVQDTLDEIGASDQPRIIVLNKIDRLSEARRAGGPEPKSLHSWLETPDAVAVSAATGRGIDELCTRVRDHYMGLVHEMRIDAPLSDARTIDYLEKRTEVLNRAYVNGTIRLTVRAGKRQLDQLLARGARIRINNLEPQKALARLWPVNGDPEESAGRIPPHIMHQRESDDDVSVAWEMRQQNRK